MEGWFYNGVEITSIDELPKGAFGFVYRIYCKQTGKFYIGKKNLYSERNVKLGKKALAELTDKRLSKKKKVVKESDWLSYYGSEPTLKEDIKLYGNGHISREILIICNNKTSLTYQELRYQILEGCLESDNCYNKQLLGKFWKNAAQ